LQEFMSYRMDLQNFRAAFVSSHCIGFKPSAF
jgi:hypothetical protein